jgi:hypothetical protein
LPRLRRAWSHETGAKWREDNPACGQCSVTALVVQDVFGGEILTTRIGGAWHFYNQINGSRFDLTESQFTVRFSYEDRKSNVTKHWPTARLPAMPRCAGIWV